MLCSSRIVVSCNKLDAHSWLHISVVYIAAPRTFCVHFTLFACSLRNKLLDHILVPLWLQRFFQYIVYFVPQSHQAQKSLIQSNLTLVKAIIILSNTVTSLYQTFLKNVFVTLLQASNVLACSPSIKQFSPCLRSVCNSLLDHILVLPIIEIFLVNCVWRILWFNHLASTELFDWVES